MIVNKKQRGIGLLELMLALGIIAILIVMATRYFGMASSSQKINEVYTQITEIRKAVYEWKSTRPGEALKEHHDGIEQLYEAGLITKKTSLKGTEGGATPFGSGTEFHYGSQDGGSIWVVGIPADVCDKLAKKFTKADTTYCKGGTGENNSQTSLIIPANQE